MKPEHVASLAEHPFFDAYVLQDYPAVADFLARLGQTRLLPLPRRPGCADIFAKCELENPTGTVKDRTAGAMLWRLLTEKRGQRPRVLEYSGGTLAIPIARLCSALGAEATLVMSSGTAGSVIAELRAHGAQLVLVPKALGFYAVMQRAAAMSRDDASYDFLYQHENSANLVMHERATGAEILEALGDRPIHAWIASIGTGGTLVGVCAAIAKHHPSVAVYATTPAELPYGSHEPPNGNPKFAGSGGLGCGVRQPFVAPFEPTIRAHFHYSYPETLRIMGEFYRETGIRIGSSSAANLAAARRVAAELGEGATVVTVFPSAGTREEWQQVEA